VRSSVVMPMWQVYGPASCLRRSAVGHPGRADKDRHSRTVFKTLALVRKKFDGNLGAFGVPTVAPLFGSCSAARALAIDIVQLSAASR
jgi:hypothetical protein